MHQDNRRTSDILRDIMAMEPTGTMSVRELTLMLGDRAFALAILIFALPNSIPLPGIPGFSTVTGLPILFIALQMIAGRDTIWLPDKVADKRFSRQSLTRILQKCLPAVVWVEKFLSPRLSWVCSPLGERITGLAFLVMALILSLPMPGGNFLPGLSMALLALGLLERDGLFVLCALSFLMMCVVLMYKFIALLVTSFFGWVGGFF